MKPIIIGNDRLVIRYGFFIKSKPATHEAAIMTGIDIKKEKRAASIRLKPHAMPAAIVEPERLTPGKRAKPWAKPITSASFLLGVCFFKFLLSFSAPNKKAAVSIRK